ncbi:hypothetical protein HanPI659440_Chr16g0651411 [Helianthus annuus]|nr:hypothetical protein HanPI659440_Chr16g0651411 [Helianthus annuus]
MQFHFLDHLHQTELTSHILHQLEQPKPDCDLQFQAVPDCCSLPPFSVHGFLVGHSHSSGF